MLVHPEPGPQALPISLGLGTGLPPVMRTSAERQAKAGMSTTKLCRERDRRWQRLEGCTPSPGPLRMPVTLEATQRQEGLSLRAAWP